MNIKHPVTLRELPNLALYVLADALRDGPCLKISEFESVSLITRNPIFHNGDDPVLLTNIPITENGFVMEVGERYFWPSYANRNLFTGSVDKFRFKYKSINDLPQKETVYCNRNGNWSQIDGIVPYNNVDDAEYIGSQIMARHRPKVSVLIDQDGGKPRKQTYDHSYHFYKGIIY